MDVLGWILIGIVAIILLWSLLMGDIVSTLVLLLLSAILGFLLVFFGFVDVSASDTQLDINIHPVGKLSSTPGVDVSTVTAMPVTGPEVFYVSDNKFTYEEAQYVCKAYDSELATYLQVEQAYNNGAEWCGYGWSAGGLALFPTQQTSWEARMTDPDPRKREMCGRPGVNGGYFDPSMKFGVNCYGIKPPKPAGQKVSKENDRMLGMFKDQVSKFVVDPYKKNTWSKYSSGIQDTHTPTNGAAPVSKTTSNSAPAPLAPASSAPAPSTPASSAPTRSTGGSSWTEVVDGASSVLNTIGGGINRIISGV
jgi:hypothetical protein